MSTPSPFRFSTKYQDDETDLLYYGYRYYDASTGQWLSRDPSGENRQRNLYESGNTFVNKFDFLGLCPCCECAVGIDIRGEPDDYPLYPYNHGTVVTIHVYMEYHSGKQTGEALLQWVERSNRPSSWLKGAVPNEWYEPINLDPTTMPWQWPVRKRSCEPPVGRVVTMGDFPTADPTLGARYLELSITIVNPSNCNCAVPGVRVSAIQFCGPNDGDCIFQTPDPGYPNF
jgi:RHS repeat-associated protein